MIKDYGHISWVLKKELWVFLMVVIGDRIFNWPPPWAILHTGQPLLTQHICTLACTIQSLIFFRCGSFVCFGCFLSCFGVWYSHRQVICMISSYKTTTNCVICSDVHLVWFFLFPRFWLGINSVYALNWCRMSHDINSRDHSLKGQLSFWLLNWQSSAWGACEPHCFWKFEEFFKCLGHSDNGFLWLKFLLMIELKLLFLGSCPLPNLQNQNTRFIV